MSAARERRLPVVPAMTEAQFRKQVTDLLTLYGWRWSYIPDSRRVQGYKGIPDIIAARSVKAPYTTQIWTRALCGSS